MKDLEARKRLLVAESEVYRQTLRLDLQNLRLYSVRAQRKFATYSALKPALMAGLPFVTSLLGRRGRERPRRRRSLFYTLISGWRMYRNFQPLAALLFAQYAARAARQTKGKPVNSSGVQAETPAAAI